MTGKGDMWRAKTRTAELQLWDNRGEEKEGDE